MVDSLQQAFPDDVEIIGTPYLAYVIQLSLNQLLDRLKAVPQNEIIETKGSDHQQPAAKENARHKTRKISHTLNKVRFLAIYIHASPQRRGTFNNPQTKEPKLAPIQDVRTRWNSTFLMLPRAKRLRAFFTPFCTEYGCEEMLLNDEEWRQINYLLCTTKPFFDYTTELSKTREVTAHLVFNIYNALFEHLEQPMSRLRRKQVRWKREHHQSVHSTHLA